MNQPTKPSPFELASIAVLLQLRDKMSEVLPAENYIQQADRLLQAAALYENFDCTDKELSKLLEGVKFFNEPSDEEKRQWVKDHQEFTSVTFDELIRPGKKLDGKKKPCTTSGTTTIVSLQKAIRRYFQKREAKRIIRDRCMTVEEIDVLKKARKQSVLQRAARRKHPKE